MRFKNKEEAAEFADSATVVSNRLSGDREERERVLQALLPAEGLLGSSAVVQQVRRNAAAHAALAKEFALLSSREVGQVAGSSARNTAEMASRWRREGKIFAVDVDGSARFPGFCFGPNGRPQPAVTGVTAALGERLSSWELALWFTASNDWLGGLRPVDALDADPDAVVKAARHLADEILV